MGAALQDKVALITGGNSGIGLATAEEFAREGAQLAITGRDEATLEQAVERLRRLGAATLAMRADVSRLAEIDRVMEQVRERFGRIDVLFVNAGAGEFAPVDQATEDHFDHLFGVNVKGAFFTVQRALPLLSEGASVIFNGSINGLIGMPGASVYSATKAAVRSFARTLSADLVGRGIRVNVVSPGPVTIPLYNRLGLPSAVLEQVAAGIQAQIPMKRFADPAEIARAVRFLATSDSSFVLGAELVADGGMSQL